MYLGVRLPYCRYHLVPWPRLLLLLLLLLLLMMKVVVPHLPPVLLLRPLQLALLQGSQAQP
jgi:hypothetical protein